MRTNSGPRRRTAIMEPTLQAMLTPLQGRMSPRWSPRGHAASLTDLRWRRSGSPWPGGRSVRTWPVPFSWRRRGDTSTSSCSWSRPSRSRWATRCGSAPPRARPGRSSRTATWSGCRASAAVSGAERSRHFPRRSVCTVGSDPPWSSAPAPSSRCPTSWPPQPTAATPGSSRAPPGSTALEHRRAGAAAPAGLPVRAGGRLGRPTVANDALGARRLRGGPGGRGRLRRRPAGRRLPRHGAVALPASGPGGPPGAARRTRDVADGIHLGGPLGPPAPAVAARRRAAGSDRACRRRGDPCGCRLGPDLPPAGQGAGRAATHRATRGAHRRPPDAVRRAARPAWSRRLRGSRRARPDPRRPRCGTGGRRRSAAGPGSDPLAHPLDGADDPGR